MAALNDINNKKLLSKSIWFISILFSIVASTNSNHLRGNDIMEEQNTNGFKTTGKEYLAASNQNSKLAVKTSTPVIGILTQVFRDYKRLTDQRHFHMASSYVKWIESAGGQILPILLNQEDAYYERVFKETNGLLFPGGDNLLDPNKDTPMMFAAKKLYKLAIDANNRGDFYPIWGTCLGLELLSVLSSNKNVLENCSAIDMSLTMDFRERGRLFAPTTYSNLLKIDYSAAIMEGLKTRNLTYNFHHKCLTETGLKQANLNKFYKPLAFSLDKSGIKFIAVFEAFNYPFYAVQFHPEKPPFEFASKKSYQNIPHSSEAIVVSRYFADFFVSLAQLNGHKANGRDKKFQEQLIYAHDPMYTAIRGDIYEQRYLFPYIHRDGISDEEFLDYVPDSDEEPPEDVAENLVSIEKQRTSTSTSTSTSTTSTSTSISNSQYQPILNSIELALDYDLVDDSDITSSPALIYNADYPGSQEDADDNN